MVPVSFNADRGGSQFRVHGKWVNYYDSTSWRAIEPEFRNDGAGFVSDRMPARIAVSAIATQRATIEVNNSWDIFSKSRIFDASFVLEIEPEGVSAVTGQIDAVDPTKVVYAGAYQVGGFPVGDLIYSVRHAKAPRLEKIVRITSLSGITGDFIEYSWLIHHTDARAFIGGQRWDGSTVDISTPVSVHSGESPVRGSGLRAPIAWYTDAAGNRIETPIATRWTRVDASTMRLTKIVPYALAETALTARSGGYLELDATATIYPDPNTEVTSWDGYIGASYTDTSDYATLIARAGSLAYASDSQSTAQIDWSNDAGQSIYRYFSLFDVSSLSGVTATGVDYRIVYNGISARTVRITEATTASNTGMTASDYLNTYTNNDTDLCTDFTINGDVTQALNATGVSVIQTAIDGTGIAKLCVRGQNDQQSTPGSTPGYVQVRTADYTGTASDPYIAVSYSAGSGTALVNGGLLGSGLINTGLAG